MFSLDSVEFVSNTSSQWAWVNHAGNAVFALVAAIIVSLLATPLAVMLARRLGAVDEPGEARRVHHKPTPLIGGLGVLSGVLAACVLFQQWTSESPLQRVGIEQMVVALAVAVVVCLIGMVDDSRGLGWRAKLAGQVACAVAVVLAPLALPATYSIKGLVLVVHVIDPPFAPVVSVQPVIGIVLAVIWIVALMNMVNFIDGVDGLAAGTCAISALTFAIIAASYLRDNIAVLSAALAGGALGFLFHNFRPGAGGGARIFLGDTGSMLLGFLLGVISIQGVLKTAAAVSLVIPLTLLAVPILDTLFVVSKRVKYNLPVSNADRWHLHHRLLNVGYSPARVTVSFWLWSASMSAVALTLRFVDYGNSHNWERNGLIAVGVVTAAALALSIYLATSLEIIKRRHVRERNASIAAARRAEQGHAADDISTG
jgi:UDP-GlcNAc:undecaprenyl-phosphate GlcNAc-1-phosphate transferase